MKKFLVILALFLGMVIVALSFSELETILETIRHANPLHLLLAFLFQAAWVWVMGRMYQSVFRLLGLEEKVVVLSEISLAANFVNVIAPSAGLGGIAIFGAEAQRRGHPAGKATVAAALFLSLDHAAFFFILSIGLVILVQRGGLSFGEITATAFMLVIAIVYAFILYLGYRSESRLADFLGKAARLVNRLAGFFSNKEYLNEARAKEFAHEVADGFSSLTEKKINLLRPILWGILEKILLALVLYASFLAFEVPAAPQIIVAGFALSYLSLMISPTPFGIGIVEGIMPIVLNSLGVNWSQAVVVTLVYRAFTFWLPFAFGAWAFRYLRMHESDT